MSDNPQAGPASGPPTPSARRAVSRATGLGIVAITGAIVFAVGAAMLPVPRPAETVVVVAPLPPPPPPSPPMPDAALAADADGADGTVIAATAAVDPPEGDVPVPGNLVKADSAPSRAIDDEPVKEKRRKKRKDRDKNKDKEKDKDKPAAKKTAPDAGSGAGGESGGTVGGEIKPENAPLPPSDGTGPGATGDGESGKDVTADCTLPEKEMAREAGRRNSPTICQVDATKDATKDGIKKAFILIPIKGSVEGETHRVRGSPVREARVILPAGSEPLLTMKQYKVKRLGFKDLRVSTTEEGGTRLRVKLQPGAGDPVIDVKDGYAKITIATPAKN